MADFDQALNEYLEVKKQCQSKQESTLTTFIENNNNNNNTNNNENNTTQIYDYERYLYNEEKDLWYDTLTGTYYKYDTASQQYIPVYITTSESNNGLNNNHQVKDITTTATMTDEEGKVEEEATKENGEPETDACCRLVVINSKILQEGTVKLVDANGITMGRDKHLWDERRWRIPDMEISKYHCQIYYDMDKKQFSVVDVGSQNGTFLNDIRLSEKKTSSSPHSIKHGDRIQLGDTLLEIHNHENDWPCEKCQTSAINQDNNSENNQHQPNQSLLKKIERNKNSIDGHQLQRQERLKELKKFAYQQNNEKESTSSPTTTGTIDRAKLRRENNKHLEKYHLQQQQQQQKELEEEIETDIINVYTPVKGRGNEMLKKMGWQQGDALGYHQQGIMEPILPTMQQGRSGIGSTANTNTNNNSQYHPISVKDQRWQKMHNRWIEQ